jgi:hypothetical protein
MTIIIIIAGKMCGLGIEDAGMRQGVVSINLRA